MAQQKKVTSTKEVPKKKWDWRRTVSAVAVGLLVGAVASLVVDKFRLHEVVCQVAGVDAENGLIAAKCMIR